MTVEFWKKHQLPSLNEWLRRQSPENNYFDEIRHRYLGRIEVWCDASVVPGGHAAGAFVVGRGNSPRSVRLRSIDNIYAEFETMTHAILNSPDESLVYTDLDHWEIIAERRSPVFDEFRIAVVQRGAIVLFVPGNKRTEEYRACHRAAGKLARHLRLSNLAALGVK